MVGKEQQLAEDRDAHASGLTVKLRGRTEARHGAEGAQFLSAKQATHHGPLLRLLGAVLLHTVFNALIQLLELVYELVAALLCPEAKCIHI